MAGYESEPLPIDIEVLLEESQARQFGLTALEGIAWEQLEN